ncbi:EPSIN/ENT-RELATED [Salix purpurea]|uniref:EPSIN/ENT-RELATED n=1 Tax=Salix purpurea TaxID=77065 RepID=A0A9Q0SK63_SALPP|nr:EPSIN/ENT-RELATED [Salix purpurea]
MASQTALTSSTGSLAIVPQPSKDKFETKSTVWADTLSRGLVNLNISGPKTNPLADIGVDFDALNRKEKRMEKQPMTPVVSTISMGKAMGSGTGLGRAGAGALRPGPNLTIGSGMGMGGGVNTGMGMGMGGGPGSGISMGGYGGIHQPVGAGCDGSWDECRHEYGNDARWPDASWINHARWLYPHDGHWRLPFPTTLWRLPFPTTLWRWISMRWSCPAEVQAYPLILQGKRDGFANPVSPSPWSFLPPLDLKFYF